MTTTDYINRIKVAALLSALTIHLAYSNNGMANQPIQLVPHDAGQMLHINSQFAIHSAHSRDATGLPLCRGDFMGVQVVLNAAPDYKITKKWLWNEFRPVLIKVSKQKCPAANRIGADFYYRGIDIRKRTKTIRDLSLGTLDGSFQDQDVSYFEPFQIDTFEYPKRYVEVRDGYVFNARVGQWIVRANFNISESFSDFTPYYLVDDYLADGDGSLVGAVKASVEYVERQVAYITKSNEKINFGVTVLLGMAAAWECGREYHDWCSGIHKGLGEINLAPTK